MNYSIKQKLQQAQALIDEAMNTNVGSIGHADLPATALARKQQLLSGININRDVFEVVNAINVLAMANTDVIHVFTDFSGHVNEFSVRAHNSSQEYRRDVPHERLIDDRIYLHKDDALEKLLSIESQLTELIINAREEAEAEADVEDDA